MKRKLFLFGAVAALMMAFSSVSLAQDTMTNDEVISLTKAGLANSIIIAKIKSSKGAFDTSSDGLIKLKQNGVADEVIAAMFGAGSGQPAAPAGGGAVPAASGDPNDPMVKRNYGIYYFGDVDGTKKLVQLQPNVSAQNRTGGAFTASITPFGLGKVKTKTNLPGREAAMQLKTTAPVFYFYLDSSSGGLNTASGIPSTPNEFTLVRFNQRSDNREVTISKTNSWGGKGGLSDEYVVPLKAEDLGNGIFRVSPAVELKKGEYGFYLLNSGNSNVNAGIGAKFFDFGVNPIP